MLKIQYFWVVKGMLFVHNFDHVTFSIHSAYKNSSLHWKKLTQKGYLSWKILAYTTSNFYHNTGLQPTEVCCKLSSTVEDGAL